MTDKLLKTPSLFSSLSKTFRALRILLSGKYFIISISRREDAQLSAKMVTKGHPYFTQVLLLQAFIRNEFETTFVNGQYMVNASDFIEHMPEIKIVGDNSCKIGMGVYNSATLSLHMHNVTATKLKKAPKALKTEIVKSVKVIFR